MASKRIVSRRFLQTLRASPNHPQLIQQSRIPTYHFQKSMPRLPIPKLEDTCARYLKVVRPILSDEEYAQTEAKVNKFRDGEGPALHEELVANDKKNSHTSYISQPWYDMYLSSRDPIAINVNPFLVMPKDPALEGQGKRKQSLRAARCVNSSLRFLRSMQEEQLVPEIWHTKPEKSVTPFFEKVAKLIPQSFSWYWAYFNGAYPLDMAQYPYLFGTTRIPKVNKDSLSRSKDSRHIVVLHKGNTYIVNVFNKDGKTPLSVEQLEGIFQSIIASPHSPAEYPLSFLTTENRDVWAKARENLVQSGNAENLNMVESALFALCLDDTTGSDIVAKAFQFLCNGNNRWYDKSFMLIVSDTSDTCVNFEHSWGDGVAILRYITDMRTDAEHPRKVLDPIPPPAPLQPLEWKLTDDVKNAVKNAEKRLKEQVDRLRFSVLIFDDFGKEYLKSQKISPDGTIQMAFQLAYFYTHVLAGKSPADALKSFVAPATYESASTSGYKHGRTETVRPASVESIEFVRSVVNGEDTKTQEEKLRRAVAVHGERTKEALMGQGVDRHLFSLKNIAQKKNTLPEIFSDPAYAKVNNIVLSTSTLSSDAIEIGGFGPVSNDGYGLGYYVSDKNIQVGCSYYHNPDPFLNNLHRALKDIGKIFGKI